MTDTMTSQNIDPSSWDILYIGLQKDVARWEATRNMSNITAAETLGER
jgi:hypothetical protein